MNIFEFNDYKLYFREWLKTQPRNGHGFYRRLAQNLRISTTMVSHIFNGEKHLTLEYATELSEFIGHNERESEYLYLLVNFARAGSHKLKARLRKRISDEQKAALRLSTRLPKHVEMTEADRAVFYSGWIYSGIRNLAAISEFIDAESISQRLNIPREVIQHALDFLLRTGLCKIKNGKIEVGPQQTRLDAHSPLVLLHHKNWRMQGFTKMNHYDEANLFYTAPMSLSRETAEKVRTELPAFIQKINQWVGPSPSEVVRCLNIDWFEY